MNARSSKTCVVVSQLSKTRRRGEKKLNYRLFTFRTFHNGRKFETTPIACGRQVIRFKDIKRCKPQNGLPATSIWNSAGLRVESGTFQKEINLLHIISNITFLDILLRPNIMVIEGKRTCLQCMFVLLFCHLLYKLSTAPESKINLNRINCEAW